MAIILAWPGLPGAWWHINGGLVVVVVLVVGGSTISSSRSNQLTVTNAYGVMVIVGGALTYLTLFLKPWGCW